MKKIALSMWLIKRWYVLIAAVGLAGLLIWSLQPRPIPAQVVTVDEGMLRSTLIDEGRTRMHETYVVSAPLTGELLRVAVEPGDQVNRGDTLAKLKPNRAGFLDARADASANAVLVAAEARLRAATAAREYAARELERAQKLADSNLTAASTLEGAKTRLKTATAEETTARAELSRARSALISADSQDAAAQITLKAPTSGYILEVPQQSETAVQIGTPIVILGDPTRIDVVAEFLSQDALRIRSGDRAFIENWSTAETQGQAIHAVVERVEPTAKTKISALGIEEQRTRVILRFDEPIPPALRTHQYRVDARVVIAQIEKAVRVPLGALFRDDDHWSVFVVRDQKAWLQPVELGIRGDAFAEVKVGLRAGDQVVLFPNRDLESGMRIEPEKQDFP